MRRPKDVLEIILKNFGLEKEKIYSWVYTDFDDLFGRWDDAEYKAVSKKIDCERIIDRELWE